MNLLASWKRNSSVPESSGPAIPPSGQVPSCPQEASCAPARHLHPEPATRGGSTMLLRKPAERGRGCTGIQQNVRGADASQVLILSQLQQAQAGAPRAPTGSEESPPPSLSWNGSACSVLRPENAVSHWPAALCSPAHPHPEGPDGRSSQRRGTGPLPAFSADGRGGLVFPALTTWLGRPQKANAGGSVPRGLPCGQQALAQLDRRARCMQAAAQDGASGPSCCSSLLSAQPHGARMAP